jgi:hypothetical protein
MYRPLDYLILSSSQMDYNAFSKSFNPKNPTGRFAVSVIIE